MKYISTGIKVILLIYLIIFCVSNTVPATVSLLPAIFSAPGIVLKNIPLFVIVAAALLVGGALVVPVHIAERMRLSGEIKNLRRKVASYESDMAKMNTMPVLPDDEEKAE